MTQYTIRKFNSKASMWGVYHITHDISDAYKVHAQLISKGCLATIESQDVRENDYPKK